MRSVSVDHLMNNAMKQIITTAKTMRLAFFAQQG